MFNNFFSRGKKPAPKAVGEFYNRTTAKFMESHGDVIQSLRTHNMNDYLDYTIKSAKITDNQVNLDAGCGVGGPSIYFAKKVNSIFHGVTISSVQAEIAKAKVIENGVQDRVFIRHGDYHDIVAMYGKEYFDRVFFLESFGHSCQKLKLLEAAWTVLKSGGILYIKDLFERESDDPHERKMIKLGVENVNKAYEFYIEDLHPIISKIRTLNFILEFIKVPEIENMQFEGFTASAVFQNDTKIGLNPVTSGIVFPVDYLEIRCKKPQFDLKKNPELYYLAR